VGRSQQAIAFGRFTAIILAAALVTGSPALAQPFPPNAPGSGRTVSWYEDHPDEMQRVNATCPADPGHAVNNPDCINANIARFSASLDAAMAKADAAIRTNEQSLHPRR
jgi:hypothetical protein